MHSTTPWFRLVATTAAGAMLAAPMLPNIAMAQGAPPAAQFNAPQYNAPAPGAPAAQPVPQETLLTRLRRLQGRLRRGLAGAGGRA